MLAGHIGVALAIGRAERRVNVGVFVSAALFLDVILWLFILVGWESVSIPASFATRHQPDFTFPYSHGLLAALGWSALAAAVVLALSSLPKESRGRTAILVAAAVFSHWILDALVHQPEMRLAGSASSAVGLALWDNLPLALALEAGIVVIGVILFLRGSRLSRHKAAALAALSLALLVFTVLGMTLAPPPPSAQAMAASSLVTLAVVCALVAWLGRLPLPIPAHGRAE